MHNISANIIPIIGGKLAFILVITSLIISVYIRSAYKINTNFIPLLFIVGASVYF